MPRAAEEPGEGVIVLIGDRVELVVVAAGTGQSEAQKRLGDHVDLVVDSPHLLFANVDRRMRSLAEEIKPGPEDRLVEALGRMPARRLEQVSGDLLGHESVVRQVGVERANHIVAVAKRVHDVVVELMAGGLGVTDQVEPVACPSFAVAGAGQQAVDESFVSVGRGIGQKRGDLRGGRGEPGQVEAQAADQGPPVGLGRRRESVLGERRLNEAIDRVARPVAAAGVHGGGRDSPDRLKAPVSGPFLEFFLSRVGRISRPAWRRPEPPRRLASRHPTERLA